MRQTLRFTAFFLSALCAAASLPAEEGSSPAVQFETQVQPLFKTRCVRCHGGEKRNAELSLATAEGLLKGGESGPAIVAGKPDESPLLELVKAGEMPPEGNEPLSAAEIALLERWIMQGAKTKASLPAAQVTQHQIVPLLYLRCVPCHGARRREADLDLRTAAGILRGGKSGAAAVAGKPEESLLVRRIRAEEMPPRRQLVSVSVKLMEATELKLLETWIAAGMPESPVGPDMASGPGDPLVSDEDRQFWSFRAPSPPTLPLESLTADDVQRIHSPIDLFVLEKLRQRGLPLSPEADRRTLLRRLSFDLTGLPPAPEDADQFIHDSSPDAYERLADRLLASPRYGERWARHWLDVAGYADSEGSQNQDRVRPSMWRYRDYVVRAVSSDKPYDRFLHEQIAGDELADYERAEEITPELYDNLVATGFLRTAPDRTFANITNFVPDRLEVVADEIQILSSAVLGLTMHCARCHSHKFDPLPQRDYYRLAAALKDALDEHDWLGPEERQLPFVTAAERRAWEEHVRQIDAELVPLKQKLESESDAEAKKKCMEEIRAVEAKKRPEPKIRALWSRGEPSPTYLLKRGNYLTPGPEVAPGVPSVLVRGSAPFVVEPPYPAARTTGRRLALARWLTAPGHPLTSRVIVNRLWKHHFGVGIVPSLANFGRTGAPPSHPELLDWLALELSRGGWSLKSLHRRLVASAVYRQSSQVAAAAIDADPDNRWLSRMPLKRLEAEALRDSLLLVAGALDESRFGPPDDVDVRDDGLVTVKPSQGSWRRSIYALHRRTTLPTILESFDSPQMGPNCIERGESIVAPQALHLLNNAVVHDLAGRLAERTEREAGTDPAAQITRLHWLAFSTPPTAEEMELAADSLAQLREQWRSALKDAPDAPREAERRALANYCHAILNSAAFLYVD